MQSPDEKSIIQPVVYDEFGRISKELLPYTSGTGAEYREYFSRDQSSFYELHYSQGQYAKNTINYDGSPLNRVVSQVGPGRNWTKYGGIVDPRGVEYYYGTNSSGEIKKYKVNLSTGALIADGYYSPGTLRKTKTTDEDKRENIEWVDFRGNTIRVDNGADSLIATTLYVYDDYGLLRWVVPPKAVANSSFPSSLLPGDYLAKELCYYYKYDERKRMIIKQIPGAEPVFFVYDKRDRLVMSQDGVQRSKSTPEWTINKYDDFDRIEFTAILNSADGHGYWTSLFKGGNDHELYEATYSFKVIIENAWDEYPSSWATGWNYKTLSEWEGYPDTATTRTRGLLTASREREIDANGAPRDWLESKYFYDEKGRLIQSYTKTDSRGSYIHSQLLIAWNGDLLKQKDTHNYVYSVSKYGALFKATIFLTEHEYDHGSRLTNSLYTLSDKKDTLSYQVNKSYDTMGRLLSSSINLQGYDRIINNFDYNIRNWVTKIKYSARGLNYFDLDLGYETNSAVPQFTGNISSATWQISSMDAEKYEYQYDDLSRLKRADYSPDNSFSTSYQYDLNGNITNLARRGFSTAGAGNMVLDDLEYSYKTSSNKLSRVDNLAPEGHGGLVNFEADGIRSDHLYDYDHNGNMTKDHRRDFSLSYNFLNLPCLINNMVNGQNIKYTYTASGVKLSQEVASINKGGVGVLRQYAGPFVYINNELAWINTPEGRVVNQHFGIKEPAGDAFAAEFHLRDHLGNTRVVLLAEGGQYSVEDFTDYYPFGMQIREQWEMPSQGDLLTNRYLYNGKEMQDDMGLGWYDYGARFYDAQIGRWHSVDPHAENYYSWSPYHYVANNPIILIDPDGRDWYQAVDDEGNVVQGGAVMWREGSDAIDGYSNIGESYTMDLGDGVSLTYNQNTPESMTETVLNEGDWETQRELKYDSKGNTTGSKNKGGEEGNCFFQAGQMVSNSGATSLGGTANNISTTNGQTNYMNAQVGAGNSVRVHVDYNGDGIGDHWVAISSRTTNLTNNSSTYNFYDPGTVLQASGTHNSNTFNVSNGTISGTTFYNSKTYIVVAVRRNQ